ncbi:type III-A CRISPR-associated RAMP protein Csm4 [Helicobacter cetorum]|uniref:type III-A CRISPR-associated RAMP protein Csm4 n=1 Tax=Helicobacter cetorum TaxID=138563 RepID=UPI000CF14069|nr:hypothetical protein [Helicobacter cetorum]
MKLFKVSIEPKSNFGSPLQGDTLFGQFCWIIRFKYSESRLKELLKDYKTKPFIIFSNAFACNYLPKPTLPQDYLNEKKEEKKENRKKIWLKLEDLLKGNYTSAKTNEKTECEDREIARIKNALNYKTFCTEKERFTPFGEVEHTLSKKDIYVLLDEKQFSLADFKKCFECLGVYGYGKNISTGLGRFEVLFDYDKNIDKKIDNKNATTFMSLGAFVPNFTKKEVKEFFYEPFTKFGKYPEHEGITNIFKKPLLMANCGAVVEFKEKKENLQYIGCAIDNLSMNTDFTSYHQAYSIVLPLQPLKRT